ncbi:hypothetical protein NDU88_003618 [Pleurodeles waltl]|uniref:Uncharacterized protein n=1 Tax=Pleurodeles waltl TaxID=8319 RepID=A0AAV7W6R6_PLEWA|nr:hypothetical protein NDU88_003618 [Pleurodeles waltl]
MLCARSDGFTHPFLPPCARLAFGGVANLLQQIACSMRGHLSWHTTCPLCVNRSDDSGQLSPTRGCSSVGYQAWTRPQPLKCEGRIQSSSPCDGAPGLTYTDGAAADVSEHADTSVPRLPVSRETIAASWRRFPVAREMHNAFRTREEEKRTGPKESGGEESQESGVEESQESGVEESQESGVKESQESGEKENQESGEKERTAQETLTRSPQASHDPGGSWLSKPTRHRGNERLIREGPENDQT